MENTRQERIKKAEVIANLAEAYHFPLKNDGVINLMVKAIDRFHVATIEKAAEIMVAEKERFSIKALIDIIYDFHLHEDEFPEPSEVIELTEAEHEEWRRNFEARDMDMTRSQYDEMVRESEQFWAERESTKV